MKYLSQILLGFLCTANVFAMNFSVVVQQGNPEQNAPGAQAVVTTPSNAKITQTTGANGSAAFGDLPSGTYSLVVTLPGSPPYSTNFAIDSSSLPAAGGDYTLIVQFKTLDQLN